MTKHTLILLATAGLLVAGELGAQNRNVALKSRANPNASGYNDVWGFYHERTGREFAILGSRTGTHIYDCTNPTSPQLKGFVPTDRSGSRNLWRDMKAFGEYLYVVSEAHGGVQIIDMRNPDSPRKVTTWGTQYWGNAHNIAMDLEEGIAYACGTNSGMIIFDVKSNPTSPRLVSRNPSGVPYVHDLSIHHGYAYLAETSGPNLGIYDVKNLPSFPLLGRARFPGSRVAHNTWPSWDGRVCITTNEVSGGPVGLFDVSNKRSPRLLHTYAESSSLPHNAYIHDRVGHMSYYALGYRGVDVSSGRMIEIAEYDTSNCWGCSLPMPSGHVYLSDINQGLFVLKPTSTSVIYGRGTVGANGRMPEAHTFGAPYLGNSSFKLDLRRGRANSPAVVVIGLGRASLTVAGIPINVNLGSPTPIVLGLTTDSNGEASLPAGVPNTAALRGQKFNVQWAVRDAGHSSGVAASRGQEIELFTR